MPHPVRLLVLLVLLVLLCGPVVAAAAQDTVARIDALLGKYHDYGLFNGSVLVADGGTVIYKKGFGYADMAWDIPNAPDTKFRIGSLTKQFTAALILQLVEQGQVDLEAPVTTYLPAYPAAQGDRVTIHHLLTHTSGIPSYTSLPGFMDFTRDPYAPDSFLAVFSGLDLAFAPGSQYSYSNSGYFLLGVIIEHVTGQPYDVVLRERLLDPLGLRDTGYDHYGEIVEQMATGYVKAGGGYEHAAYLDTSVPYAAGMMYSTVEDLYRWNEALHRGAPFTQAATLERMTTPFLNNYAYGLSVFEAPLGGDSVRTIAHGGGIFGFATMLRYMPDEGRTVIVFDNTEQNAGAVAYALTQLLYGVPVEEPKQPSAAEAEEEVAVPAAVLAEYVGRYQLQPNFILTVTREGAQLYTQATGQSRVAIYPASETRFFLKVVDAQLTFHRNEQGEVTGLTLHQGGLDLPAPKIE